MTQQIRIVAVALGLFIGLLCLTGFWPIYLTLEEYTYILAARGHINSSEWLAQLLQSTQPLDYNNLFFTHPHHLLYGVLLKALSGVGDVLSLLYIVQTMNAAFATGCTIFVYMILRKSGNVPVGIALAATFGSFFSFGMLRYGTGAEVYLPAIFFMLWGLYVFFGKAQYEQGGNRQKMAWFLLATAVLFHVIVAVVVLAAGFSYLFERRLNPGAIRRLLKCGLPALGFLLAVLAGAAYQSLELAVKDSTEFRFWDFSWFSDYLFLYFQAAAGEFSLTEFDGWSQLGVSLGLWSQLLIGSDSSLVGLLLVVLPAGFELGFGHRLVLRPGRFKLSVLTAIFYGLYLFIFWWSYNAYDYYLFLVSIFWLLISFWIWHIFLNIELSKKLATHLEQVPFPRRDRGRLTKKIWDSYDTKDLTGAATTVLSDQSKLLSAQQLKFRYFGRERKVGLYHGAIVLASFSTTDWTEGNPSWSTFLFPQNRWGVSLLKFLPGFLVFVWCSILFSNMTQTINYRGEFALAKVCKTYKLCGKQLEPVAEQKSKLLVYDFLSPGVLFWRLAEDRAPVQAIAMDLSGIDFNRDFRQPGGHFSLAYEIWLGELRRVRTYGINVDPKKSLFYAWQWAHFDNVTEIITGFKGDVELYGRQLTAGFVKKELKRKRSRFLERNKDFEIKSPFGLYGAMAKHLAKSRTRKVDYDLIEEYKSLPRSMRHFTEEPKKLKVHHSVWSLTNPK